MEDLRNEIKIAYSYYVYGMTQMQIAKKFNISRQKVIRELKRAQQENIVKIEIAEYYEENLETEKMLEDAFGLIDSVVVPNSDYVFLEELLSEALANYLKNRMDTCSVLGVGGGHLLEMTAPHLNQKYSRVSVVQLMGSLLKKEGPDPEFKNIYDSDRLVIAYSQKLAATPYFLHAPLFAESERHKAMLLDEPYIKKSFEMIDRCTVGIFEVFDREINETLLKAYDEQLYRETADAAGSVIFNYYDENGRFIDLKKIKERLLAPSVGQLRKIPLRIGIGGGSNHIGALLGALRSGFFHIVMTDNDTALALLKKHRQ